MADPDPDPQTLGRSPGGVAQRVRHARPSRDPELAVGAREVDLDRLGRDEQPLGDVVVLCPSAARRATRSSLGVSDPGPLSASRRGRAPVASSSARASSATGAAPSRPASSKPRRSGSRAAAGSRAPQGRPEGGERLGELQPRGRPVGDRDGLPEQIAALGSAADGGEPAQRSAQRPGRGPTAARRRARPRAAPRRRARGARRPARGGRGVRDRRRSQPRPGAVDVAGRARALCAWASATRRWS